MSCDIELQGSEPSVQSANDEDRLSEEETRPNKMLQNSLETSIQSYSSQTRPSLNQVTIMKRKKGFSQGSCSGS